MAAASLAVAALALGGTVWQAFESHRQNELQDAQLGTLEDQFAAAGPLLEANFSVDFSEMPGEADHPEIEGPDLGELDEDGFAAYNTVWLRVRLLNVGRAETSLQEVGLEIAEGQLRRATDESTPGSCIIQGGEFRPCSEAFPVMLAPGTRYEVWLPLSEYVGSFDMATFGVSGMPLVVEATGLADAPYRTTTGLRVTD